MVCVETGEGRDRIPTPGSRPQSIALLSALRLPTCARLTPHTPSQPFPPLPRPLDKLDANAINSLKITDRDFDGDEIYLEDLWQESIPVPHDALKRLGLKIQFSESGRGRGGREGGRGARGRGESEREGAEGMREERVRHWEAFCSLVSVARHTLDALSLSHSSYSRIHAHPNTVSLSLFPFLSSSLSPSQDPILALQGDHKARVAAFVADLLDDDEGEAELPTLAMRRPVVMAMAITDISAKAVKQLRDKTGAGMMDCKKALAECDGNDDKAMEWLRQKGLSGADKKAGRVAAEGAIVQYIHPGSRLGVLLEVNCETDFVAAGEKFQQLVGELGMIVAASPDVQCVNPEDVSAGGSCLCGLLVGSGLLLRIRGACARCCLSV